YKDRPPGSASKLRTYRDGVRILLAILLLFKEERPLAFFGLAGLGLMVLSLALGYPVLTEYLATGLVPRFPTAILATGLMTLAFLSFASGLILETVTRGRKELKRLAYLAIPGPR
ncbi:MAG: glycosyl transferase, partial [Gammaproteobacteria bacterium]|nr:glycosyl transferase [Gammaproteobacteria bacterium]